MNSAVKETNTIKELEKKIIKLEESISSLQKFAEAVEEKNNHFTIILISNNYDKLMFAFSLSATAASLGMKVSLIFAFWSVSALKTKSDPDKSFLSKMISFMLPTNIEDSHLSKFHFFGLGTWGMKKLMKKNHMPSLSQLLAMAKSMDIKFIACAPTLQIMGTSEKELFDNIQIAGAATFLSESRDAGTCWVI